MNLITLVKIKSQLDIVDFQAIDFIKADFAELIREGYSAKALFTISNYLELIL